MVIFFQCWIVLWINWHLKTSLDCPYNISSGRTVVNIGLQSFKSYNFEHSSSHKESIIHLLPYASSSHRETPNTLEACCFVTSYVGKTNNISGWHLLNGGGKEPPRAGDRAWLRSPPLRHSTYTRDWTFKVNTAELLRCLPARWLHKTWRNKWLYLCRNEALCGFIKPNVLSLFKEAYAIITFSSQSINDKSTMVRKSYWQTSHITLLKCLVMK
jgi:hypothetical protein